MRNFITLVLLLLCLCTSANAQNSVLEKKVTVNYRSLEIYKILKDLTIRYNLNFSYSTDIIPENKKVSLNFKNVMLKDVLYDIFTDTDIAFQVVGDQIVLKKGIKKNTSIYTRQINPISSKRDTLQKLPVLYHPENYKSRILASTEQDLIIDTLPDKIDLSIPLLMEDNSNYSEPTKREVKKKYRTERKLLKAKYKVMKLEQKSADPKLEENVRLKYNYITQKLKQEYIRFLTNTNLKKPTATDSTNSIPSDSTSKADTTVTQEKEYLYAPYQCTFAGNIGTHGEIAPQYVNAISMNIIQGTSAGVQGIELGGVVNIDLDYVKGIQMAGVANIVEGPVTGIQLSGVANINKDSTSSLQAAGVCNLSKGPIYGLQVSGFCNINNSTVKGYQGAGYINIVADSLYGIQTAGFANINQGVVTGIQLSGFLNVAKKINGMQLGIINISDSCKGLPIGLISIVKYNGHRVLDVSGSEALYLTVSYKMGVKSFYNIFPVGAQYKKDKLRIGVGYGIGSEFDVSSKVFMNTELTSLFIWEEGMQQNSELNLMNRLNTNFGFKLGNRSALFFGPALSVMVSSYKDPDTPTITGSAIAPYALTDYTFTGTKDVNLKTWFGFNAGIRF